MGVYCGCVCTRIRMYAYTLHLQAKKPSQAMDKYSNIYRFHSGNGQRSKESKCDAICKKRTI